MCSSSFFPAALPQIQNNKCLSASSLSSLLSSSLLCGLPPPPPLFFFFFFFFWPPVRDDYFGKAGPCLSSHVDVIPRPLAFTSPWFPPLCLLFCGFIFTLAFLNPHLEQRLKTSACCGVNRCVKETTH